MNRPFPCAIACLITVSSLLQSYFFSAASRTQKNKSTDQLSVRPGAMEDAVRAKAQLRQPVLQPRKVLEKSFPVSRPQEEHCLVVKFRDHLGARAVKGKLRLAHGEAEFFSAELEEEMARMGVGFEQLVQLPDDTLQFLELRGAINSGIEQPDLASLIVVDAPDVLVETLAFSFFACDEVEWIEYFILNPPPPYQDGCSGDIPPTTPNYVHQQGYHGPNPGLNMTAFWNMGNARGAGIRVSDCEYGYNLTHEDLCGIIPEPNQTPHPTVYSNNWHEHGTAVFGEMAGRENAYGVSGLAPDAKYYFFPEWTVQSGSRRPTCIANAIAAMLPGDIVLLEMQTTFPGTSGYGPAELSNAVWTIVKNGTDGGVVVVGAAGNGNQNLDAPEFATYRAWGDSGAIIVGAGSASVAHNKLSFSTYGNRVNVQGWGQSVFTTGYGNFSQIGSDANQSYTAGFSGTSSASPFIAASCAALQSYAVTNIGRRLTPLELRHLFLNTGHAQGTGGNIGRFPNLVQAAELMSSTWGPNFLAPTSYLVNIGANPQGTIGNLVNSDDLRLCADGEVPLRFEVREQNTLAVQMTIQGTLPVNNPSRFGIKLEGRCNVAPMTQRLELYNFQLQNWQVVDSRILETSVDQTTWLEIPGSPLPFIQPGSRQVNARVTFTQRPEVTAPNWTACIDQFVWFYKN